MASSKQVERRDLLAQLFIVVLIGLAYQEMIPPVRDSLGSQGITFPIFVLFSVFFLTSLRFFIGAQLHLIDESITGSRSAIWIFDFMVIVFEMIIFIFLGGLTSVEANIGAHFDFIQLLAFIYVVDVVWVAFQFVLSRASQRWYRADVPWQWAVINLVALAIIVPLYLSKIGIFTNLSLAILLIVNAVAFVLDVLVVDYFSVVKGPSDPVAPSNGLTTCWSGRGIQLQM